MDYALFGYPLSQGFKDRFESQIGTQPKYLFLQELRRLSMPKLFSTLRQVKADRLFLPLENAGSVAVLPALYCLAAVTGSRKIELVHPDLKREVISRWQTFRAMTDVVQATLSAQWDIAKCRRELKAFLKADRQTVAGITGPGPVLYLRTNMSFGVTAGGMVGHIAGVVNGLIGHEYPVHFISTELPSTVSPKVDYHEVQPLSAYALPYVSNLYRFQHSFVKQAQQIARSQPFQFVYQRMSVGNYAGVNLARELQLPLVLEYNGSEVWVQANWGPKDRFVKLVEMCEEVCLKHAHVVVTVSEVLKDELIQRGVDAHRIVCHPNCIDPEVFNPERFSANDLSQLRSHWKIPGDAIVAGFVGTFGQWHGVEVLAAAVRKFAETEPDWLRRNKLHFLIVGDGLGMAKVREILSHPACEPFFTLTGLVPQAEAPRYMAACDLLLSPHVPNTDGSRFFGSPTKLFEYMAMGKGIVASDLEQIGQVLRPGLDITRDREHVPSDAKDRLAVLCRPGELDDVMSGIRWLVEDAGLRNDLGKNSRREALENYTWDRHTEAILKNLTTNPTL